MSRKKPRRQKDNVMGTLKSPPPLLEFWVPANLDAVPPARKRAMRVCNDAGLSDDDCLALDLALGEALANAVLHGGASAASPDGQIYLGLWNFRGRLIIHVKDNGSGFVPPPPPYAMPEAHKHQMHGRGLPLMETLTDALAVCRGCIVEGGASVFLIKAMPVSNN